VLLDERGAQAQRGGRRGDLAGVVGLHAADADEGVAALGEGVREEVSRVGRVREVVEWKRGGVTCSSLRVLLPP
jgi:hypothetical protein